MYPGDRAQNHQQNCYSYDPRYFPSVAEAAPQNPSLIETAAWPTAPTATPADAEILDSLQLTVDDTLVTHQADEATPVTTVVHVPDDSNAVPAEAAPMPTVPTHAAAQAPPATAVMPEPPPPGPLVVVAAPPPPTVLLVGAAAVVPTTALMPVYLRPEELPPPSDKPPGSGGGAKTTYILQIHKMLEDSETERNTDIVSWLSHGRAFRVHNVDEFTKTIMPRYFKALFNSFCRWLRAWGFVRMTEGKDRGAWYHRYFVRGVTSLCRNMTRQQMFQSMQDWLPAGEVPDFYAPATGLVLSETAFAASQKPGAGLTKNPKKLRGTILEDVRQMLKEAEEEGNEDIVSWMPHGLAFMVYDSKDFEKDIMPRYFKTKKVGHFSDALRIWGFARLKQKSQDKGAYYHKYFVRGDASLSRHQSRQQMKEAMKGFPKGGVEPNLYQPQPPPSPSPAPATAPPPQHPHLPAAARAPVAPSALRTQQVSDHHTPNFRINPLATVKLKYGHLLNDVDAANAIKYAKPKDDSKHADTTYVLRIHEMLEDSEKDGNQKIVSWQPHGRAFRVHNESEFIEKIMPRYFKAKIGSFRRWLRAWGFVRMTEGQDRGAWYHRYFVRGVTSLCCNMSRQEMHEAMENWLPSGQIPDFNASGFCSAFSEAPRTDGTSNIRAKNPRKLRGTACEDLRQMLEEAAENGDEEIVSWMSHGRAFKVHIKSEFAEKIMPRYFKAKKFQYFSDTLRIWGFQRLKNGKDKGAYFHRFFVRGNPSLTRHLSRQQMRQAMNNWPGPKGELDLYNTTLGEQISTAKAPPPQQQQQKQPPPPAPPQPVVAPPQPPTAAEATQQQQEPHNIRMLDEKPLDITMVNV